MYYNRTISALVLSVVIIISACSTPHHTNTLIFATNTKFAIDIAADPTGYPSLTVGYKRQEAVWMPLLANKDNKGTSHADNKFLFLGKQEPELQNQDQWCPVSFLHALKDSKNMKKHELFA